MFNKFYLNMFLDQKYSKNFFFFDFHLIYHFDEFHVYKMIQLLFCVASNIWNL